MSKGLWVLALIALAGCDTLSPEERFQQARNRWLANRPDGYAIVVARSCECTQEGAGPVLVEVLHQTVTSREYMLNGATVSPSLADVFPSVDGLFEMIQSALERRVAILRVEYHPTLGYPTSIFIDEVSSMVDDEVTTTVKNLTEVAID